MTSTNFKLTPKTLKNKSTLTSNTLTANITLI